MAGQLWSVNTLGGYLYALNLSDELREALQPVSKFRQFADIKDASQQGKKHGDTFTWDVVGTVARANRQLAETNTIGEGNFTIYQATMTVQERGHSIPYSGKLEALSQFEVRQPIMRALKNDAARDLDALAWQQFNRCALRATLQTNTTIFGSASTAPGTASIAMNTGHVKDIVDEMRERNIPGYTGDDYYALARPKALRQVKNNLESIHQYTERGLGMIMNGEIGRYENTRFVEQTHIARGGATDSVTFDAFASVADAWNNSSSGAMDWVFFFGEDTVGEGIVIPEEMRAKIPTDFGRSKGVAWYCLEGYGLAHEQPTECRVVKVDSAV
jgi:N4-gp56 family major capsid protein